MDSEEDPYTPSDEPNFSGPDDSSSNAPETSDGQAIKRPKDDNTTNFTMPPSPPTFITMRQLTEATNAFYNMTLAHEITVDSEFRIEKYEPPETSLEHTVKRTMERAFWDILRSSLQATPPDYQPALRLLGEIKQSLSGLVLPNQKTLQRLVDSSLDLDAARDAVAQTGILNLNTYAIRVINVMRQFCAPVRDQEVEDLRAIDDPVEAFRSVFDLLEKMHMDLANFTIIQMRPYIRQQAVSYERAKFGEFLDAQKALSIDGLRWTRSWITEAYTRVAITAAQSDSDAQSMSSSSASVAMGSTSSRQPNHSSSGRDPATQPIQSAEYITPTPNNILREAYLSLLSWPTNKEWPETVLMDQQRLRDLGQQLTNIVTLTSLVLVVCNFVASNAIDLFTNSGEGIRVDPALMVELKRLICLTGVSVLRSNGLDPTETRAEILAEETVFTMERWHTDVTTAHQQLKLKMQRPSITEASKDRRPSLNPELESINRPNDQFYQLPQSLRRTLVSQVKDLVHGNHPVYTLMNKRALAFLRTALSAQPPEQLNLPPGFSILLDVTRQSQVANLMAHPTKRTVTKASTPESSTTSESKTVPETSSVPAPVVPTMATEINLSANASADTLTSAIPLNTEFNLSHLSLTNMAARIMPLLAHNRHVFGPQYAEIMQVLLASKHQITAANSPTQPKPDQRLRYSTYNVNNRKATSASSSTVSEEGDRVEKETSPMDDQTTFELT